MKIVHTPQTDSTQCEARRILNSEIQAPFWVLADCQSEGRGRLGRQWVSVSGNLYCTGVYPAFLKMQTTALLSFCAALAVHDVLGQWIDTDKIKIKWPNDVLVAGRKIAGILLETMDTGKGSFVLIGIGVNIVSHPNLADRQTTDMQSMLSSQSAGNLPKSHTVLQNLVTRFAYWYDILEEQGFAPVKSAWNRSAYGLNRQIEAVRGKEKLLGVALGLDETGALLLRTQNGKIEKIMAGDVFFL